MKICPETSEELDDDHPIRLTNHAATFDHSEESDYEFTWWVPRPGRGTNFWIPLRINPEQENLWHDLVSEDAKAGEIRLQQHRKNWVLHVTVEYPVEEPSTDGDATHIGLDIGETALLTGCTTRTVLRLTRSCVAEAERSISAKRYTRP